MTTSIMTRSAARTTEAVTGPDHQLGQLLARMVREADARIPQERRARRTLQEMAPGYERQPVLVLARPVMADDACPLCGRWNCNPATCPPPSAVPASTAVTASGEGQCSRCGGVFPGWNGGVCDACQATGR